MPNPHNEQAGRRQAIIDLLRRGPVPTQQALVAELDAQGFAATQSSVSRDLRELGVVKTVDGYALPDDDLRGGDPLETVRELLRDVHTAGPHLLVIRTAIGAAQRVALALDRSHWPEIVGNIGGDDTVFVATDSASHQKALATRIARAVTRSRQQSGRLT